MDLLRDTIPVVIENSEEILLPNGTRGSSVGTGSWRDEIEEPSNGKKGITNTVQVSIQKLEQEMARVMQVLGRLFSHAEQQIGLDNAIQLDEIELSVEISAEGEIKLVGTGAKAGSKGAIKLTFKRQDATLWEKV